MRKWCSCAAKKIVVRPSPQRVHRKVPAGEFPVQQTIELADQAAHPFTSKLTKLMNCTLPPAFSTSITTATWTLSAASCPFVRPGFFRNSGDEFVLAVFRLKRALWPWRSPVVGGVVGSLIFVHAIVGLVQQRLHDAAFIIGGDRPTVGVAESEADCRHGLQRRLQALQWC